MIEITEKASAQIKQLMADEVERPYGLRIEVVGGGCAGFEYRFSWTSGLEEGDENFGSNEAPVIIDEMSLQYMNGSVLDFSDGLNGSGFQLNNPLALGGCGCGQSFDVDEAALEAAGSGGCNGCG